ARTVSEGKDRDALRRARRGRRRLNPDAQGSAAAPRSSPARAVVRYASRYRYRYLAGYLCLGAGTGLSLAIPWTVKRAIDSLERDAAAAPIGALVTLIIGLAILNGTARLGSRFAIIGAAQRVEFDVRNDLYASMQSFSPAAMAERGTGDLMSRASSDVAGVKQLVRFGGLSLVSTTLRYAG